MQTFYTQPWLFSFSECSGDPRFSIFSMPVAPECQEREAVSGVWKNSLSPDFLPETQESWAQACPISKRRSQEFRFRCGASQDSLFQATSL